MEEKLCSAHGDDIIGVCFFEGCNQLFLCMHCPKHPDNHTSQSKNIISLMKNENWIKPYEYQRDLQITVLKTFNQDMSKIVIENQEKLKEMISEIIQSLKTRLAQWIEELDSMLNFERKGANSAVEENIRQLEKINFREGNIYDKVEKVKLFNESTLPQSTELSKLAQSILDENKIDQGKIASFKDEVLNLLQNIQLKSLFFTGEIKHIKISEQLALLHKEYTDLKDSSRKQIQVLNQEIESLQNVKEQNNQLTQDSTNYKKKIASLEEEIKELQKQVSILKPDVQSLAVVNSKLEKQLILLQEEYADFQDSSHKQTQVLNQEIENLQKAKEKNVQFIQENSDYKKIANLEGENKGLQKQISRLKTEVESLAAFNCKLEKQYEDLNKSYSKLEEKYAKSQISFSENSKIINTNDYAKILSWLPTPKNFNSQTTCQLNLLYRASRDSFTPSSFYAKCGCSAPTISFIRSKEHGRVFGGYTTKSWSLNPQGYIEDKDAFLFSLTHNEKYPVKVPQHAILARKDCILCFGGGGGDINLGEGCNIRQDHAYSYFPQKYECSQFASYNDPGARKYLAGSKQFLVEEIEVYQVVWIG